MKKSLIFIISCFTIMSCKKQGHVYEAKFMDKDKYYSLDKSGSITTNFFFTDDKDSLAAIEWYIKTEAYKDNINRCDSFWIEYWGTADEWGKHRL